MHTLFRFRVCSALALTLLFGFPGAVHSCRVEARRLLWLD
jgi:hypothetical protein